MGRAGASSVAEFCAAGVPQLLVPYPFAAGGHQMHNARELERAGACVVIPDAELGERLLPELTALANEVAWHDGLFTAHVRGSSETLLRATEELVRIARDSGARVHHSHMEAVGERFWGDVPAMLERLARRGVARLLVEGGGELNWSFFACDAVDELYVTVAPTLLGGRDAPTLLGGPGWRMSEQRRLRLLEVRREADELYCRYTVVRDDDEEAAR